MSKNVASINKEVPVKAEPQGVFKEMEERMQGLERHFELLFPRNWYRPMHLEFPEWAQLGMMELKTPKVDIVDRDDDILVRAEIPGFKKEDLDISLTDIAITIKGSTSEEKKEEKGNYFRSETRKGSFSRTLPLPTEVDGSKAKSTFNDGMLEVIVPKHGHARKHRVKIS
jgi:HSP20 family protein